jgi:hypothetical protein
MCGAFDENFAFHFNGADEGADARHELGGKLTDREEGFMAMGYVYRDGVTRKLKKALKTTQRARNGIEPERLTLDITDEKDDNYRITGEITARLPFHCWPNMLVYMCQARFECNGKIGLGEVQDIFFGESMRKMIT